METDSLNFYNFAETLKISSMSSARYRIVRTVCLWFFGIMVYSLFYQAIYNLIAYRTVFPYSSASDMVSSIVRNSIPIFIIFALDYLIIFHLTNKNLSTPVKIAVDALFAVAVMVLVNMVYSVTLQVEMLDWPGTAFNSVITFFILSTLYYVRHYQRILCEREMYRTRILEYKYATLKAQVNPHFLFNSLNVLYSLVKMNREESLPFIESLSQIYHYILRHQKSDIVNLEDEMAFARDFSHILMLRYKDQLVIETRGAEMINGQKIIPYSLQLTIENVVKHNVMSIDNPIRIEIDVTYDMLTISNTYRPKKTNERYGVGLNYLTQLYELKQRKLVYGISDDRFIVNIPLI